MEVSGQRQTRPLHSQKKKLGTHCTGGWVGPRAYLDALEKTPFPLPQFELLIVQSEKI